MSYYDILGVKPTASFDEIKKAYRQLSLEKHPDRDNGNNAEFIKLNEAYTVLCDSGTREQYDARLNKGMRKFGSNLDTMEAMIDNSEAIKDLANCILGDLMMGGGETKKMVNNAKILGGDIMSYIWGDVFKGNDLGKKQRGTINVNDLIRGQHNDEDFSDFNETRMRRASKTQIKPLHVVLPITLTQAFNGGEYAVEIERKLYGINDVEIEHEKLYVTVKEGIDDGEVITIPCKGHQHGNGEMGDLKVAIKLLPYIVGEHIHDASGTSIEMSNTDNDTIERKDLDLIYTKNITLKEALCGFTFNLQHINGKSYKMNNKQIIGIGTTKVISGLGMKRGTTIGNMIIRFKIEFPKTLPEDTIKKLAEVL